MPFLLSASIQYIITDDFSGSFLNFQARYNDVMSHLSDSVMYVLIIFVGSIILGVTVAVTFFIFCLGLAVAFVGNLIFAHIIAQYGLALYGPQGGGNFTPAPSGPADLAF